MDEKNTNKKRRRLLGILGGSALVLALVAVGIFYHFYNKMDIQQAEELAPEATIAPEDIPQELELPVMESEETEALQNEMEENLNPPVAEEGVYNLLLLGVDARYDTAKSRTDTVMVVSINKEEKTIAITSFLRDMYILIPNYGYQRLNVANVVGGPAMLIDTIEQNFGIPVDNYAFINFYSFIDVIDALGGVDISLTDVEVMYINYWVFDTDLMVDYDQRIPLEYREDGQYHLDGMQALAYCRLRNIGADPGRTERQRNMMSILWESTKDMNLATLTQLADAVLPHVTTDLSPATCLSLLSSMIAYRDFELVSQQIPANGTFDYSTVGDMSVLTVNYPANREILQQVIYGKTPAEDATE